MIIIRLILTGFFIYWIHQDLHTWSLTLFCSLVAMNLEMSAALMDSSNKKINENFRDMWAIINHHLSNKE